MPISGFTDSQIVVLDQQQDMLDVESLRLIQTQKEKINSIQREIETQITEAERLRVNVELKLTQAQQRCARLEAQLDEQLKRGRDLTRQLEAGYQQSKELQTKGVNKQGEYNAQQQENKNLEKQIQQLQLQIQEKTEAVTRQTKELHRNQVERDATNTEFARLESQEKQQLAKAQLLRTELGVECARRADAEKRLASISAEIEAEKIKFEKDSAEVKQLESQVESSTSARQELQRQAITLQQTVIHAKAVLEEQSKQKSSLSAALACIQSDLSTKVAQDEAAAAAHASNVEKLNEKRSIVSNDEQKLEQLKDNFESELRTQDLLRQQLQQLQTTSQAKEQQIREEYERNSRIQTQNGESQVTIDSNARGIEAYQAQIKHAEAGVKELELMNQRLQQNVVELQEQHNLHVKTLQEYQEQLDALKQDRVLRAQQRIRFLQQQVQHEGELAQQVQEVEKVAKKTSQSKAAVQEIMCDIEAI